MAKKKSRQVPIAKKGKTTLPMRSPVKTKRNRPLPENDNPGEASWRAGQPSADQVHIPEHLSIEINQSAPYLIIAHQHGVFMFRDVKKEASRTNTFGLWGHKDNVAAAKQAILSSIRTSQQTSRTDKYPSLLSLTDAGRDRYEKRWQRHVRLHQYRQLPPGNMPFMAIETFRWPFPDRSPLDILGPSLEALDTVRMSSTCYIVFDQAKNAFVISSPGKETNLDKARVGLRRMCSQVLARETEPLSRYVTCSGDYAALDGSVESARIARQTYQGSGLSAGGSLPCLHPGDMVSATAIVSRSNGRDCRIAIINEVSSMLSKLHYYRGHLRLRFRLGVFLAVQYMEPGANGWSLAEFQSMLELPQFTGRVTQELGTLPIEQSLPDAIYQAKDFVTPIDPDMTDVTDTQASYEVTFEFTDQSDNLLRLSIAWEQYKEGYGTLRYDRVWEKWTRAEPVALVDVSMIDLIHTQAWQIDLHASNTVDTSKLPSDLLRFAASIELHQTEPTSDSWQMCRHGTLPLKHRLQSIHQRRVFQYHVARSDYTLEVAQFQTRRLGKEGNAQPRWSVELFRSAWDEMLAANELMPVGGCTKWSHNINEWFRDDQDASDEQTDELFATPELRGVGQLLAKMDSIARLFRAEGARS